MPPDAPEPPLPSLPPPPIPSRGTLPYGDPRPNPGSQWYTDGHAYGAAMVYGLLALTVLSAVLGAGWWVVSLALHYFLGW